LQQIIYLHLAKQMALGEVQSRLKYVGFDNVNQAQIRIAWLGHTVGASLPYAVGEADFSGAHAWIVLPADLSCSFCLICQRNTRSAQTR
jgi:hypothetical protein